MSTYDRPDIDCILPRRLKINAEIRPYARFIEEVGGRAVTYAEAYESARAIAVGLRNMGVTPGARVVSMMASSADSVLVLAACSIAGAVHVPLNVTYLGPVLEHALNVAEPTVVIVDSDLSERMTDLKLGSEIRPALVIRGRSPVLSMLGSGVWREVTAFSDLYQSDTSNASPFPEVDWSDTATLLFTSGTTGLSKAVIVPWLQLYLSSTLIWPGSVVDSSDRMYSPWPLNHISGTGAVYAMVASGGCVVLREKWSTSSFMSDVIDYRCTITTLMGEMVGYVNDLPYDGAPEDFPLKKIFCTPTPAYLPDMMERFGARYMTNFNSTELSSPIGSVGLDPVPVGSCGVVRPHVEVKIVDSEGNELTEGEPGELLVRTKDPAAMNGGYYGAPEATREAWAGGWFHTGDLLRRDEDGYYYFLGRLKDRIRSRGENVSGDEVELIVSESPAVRQCSVVGRPLEHGEDEIVLFAVPTDCENPEQQIREHCEQYLPKFMRPARIILVDELPETPTGKIRRAKLRASLQ